jgi:uncharacterized protein (DUF2062 family)
VTQNLNPPSTDHPSLFQRRIVTPILDLLRVGCSPRKMAWSLAFGIIVGINPLLGSTTVVSLLFAFALRLNLIASQIANHVVYPLQLALFLVFIKLGDRIFHTGKLPMDHEALLHGVRHHPIATTKILWMWEWHALIVWAVFSAIAAPLMVVAMTPMLNQLHARLQKQEIPA